MTANLLAEKPYGKYCKTHRLDFEIRKARFLELISDTKPDLLLLQEVDAAWNSVLSALLSQTGYQTVFGDCWSSGLAMAWNTSAFSCTGLLPSEPDAGLLIAGMECLKTRSRLHLVNLHAPWGKAMQHAEAYRMLIPSSGPMVVAGDFNTDNPAVNNNHVFLMIGLFAPESMFLEATQTIDMTARNVNTNDAAKLDYIVTRGLKVLSAKAVPSELALLLPHNEGGAFNAQNPLNHYSDHAAVFAELDW